MLSPLLARCLVFKIDTGTSGSIVLIVSTVHIKSAFAYSNNAVLKQGMHNSDASELQNDLKVFGFFSESPTVYFGNITKTAVVSFQKRFGLTSDGIVGKGTILKINSIKKNSQTTSRSSVTKVNASSGKTKQSKKIQLLPWFDKVKKIYGIGDVATVIDIKNQLKNAN